MSVRIVTIWCVFVLSGILIAEENKEELRRWAEALLNSSQISSIEDENKNNIGDKFRRSNDKELNAGLMVACRMGKIQSVKRLVELGADPAYLVIRHPAIGEETPLTFAVTSGHRDIVTYLITKNRNAIHFTESGEAIEVGTAAVSGRFLINKELLDLIKREFPGKFQVNLRNAVWVMIGQEKEKETAELLKMFNAYMSDDLLHKLIEDLHEEKLIASLKRAWKMASQE